MTPEEKAAVVSILDRLHQEGLQWFRKVNVGEVDLIEQRVSGGFSAFDGGDLHTIHRKPRGSLPYKKMIVMRPAEREEKAMLGLRVKWDFDSDPHEYRLFLGQWSKIDGDRTFLGFRFDSPEQGEEHNYYHCQPCRDLGDRETVPDAAPVSHRFPTIPLKARNIVELTVCLLMSSMGHKRTKNFMQGLLSSGIDSTESLKSAYRHCLLNV